MRSSTSLGLGLLLLIFFISVSETAKSSAKNGQSLKSWLRSMRPKRNENSLASDRIWTLADALPGEPGRDYPIFATAPETGFSCDDKHYGYYADIEARCQVFHICANTAGSSKGFEFLCPNGTLFNQRFFVCDWYMNVDCEGSDKYFNLNDLIGDSMNGFTHNDIMSTAKDMMMFTRPSKNGLGGGGSNSGPGKGDKLNGEDFNNRRNGGSSNNRPSGNAGGPSNGNRPSTSGTNAGNGNVPLRGSANLAQPTAGVQPGYSGNGNQQNSPQGSSGKTPYGNGGPQGGLGSQGGKGGQGGQGGKGNQGGLGSQGNGQGTKQGNGQGNPQRGSQANPQGGLQSRPQGSTQAGPQNGLQGGPQGSSQSSPQPGLPNGQKGSKKGSQTDPQGGLQGSQGIPQSGSQNGLSGGPQRGANSPTVYVNNLGQLSTDNGSGFDPKHSFILRPDKDSNFDQDPRIPSNSFDILKGIENSYSFGFPDDINPPLRGSADLSEPVDLSIYGPTAGNPALNGNRKQIYTYPHDQNGISPEQQGQLNTKLSAQAPKYPAAQVYGPAITQPGQFSPSSGPSSSSAQGYPQEDYRVPSSQPIPQTSSQRGPSTYPGSNGNTVAQNPNYPSTQRGPSPQAGQGYPSSQGNGVPQRTQYPSQQRVPSSQGVQKGQSNGQRGPAPSSQSHQQNPLTQPQRTSSIPSSQSQKPQKALPSSYQPTQPRVDTPHRLYQQPHAQGPSSIGQQSFTPNSNQQQAFIPSSNGQQSYAPNSNQQQTQRRQFDTIPDNRHFYQAPNHGGKSHGPSQSNEEYLRVVLKDKNHVHDDNMQLIELIQRFFVPQHTKTRVVSAEVHPSQAQESYSFTYDGNGAATNTRNNYQPLSHSGYHQHSNNCGHQGY
ncbi:hypothetical protein ACKWTF_003081 [Chironomus riparius]